MVRSPNFEFVCIKVLFCKILHGPVVIHTIFILYYEFCV